MMIKRLGVFATPDEVAALKAVLNAPYIVVGGIPPKNPQKVAHQYALAHGLPEIEGYYGCDLTSGEFVSV